ncbi:quinoprotein dehydrogenase-associated SoxYZ-like carrier [Aureimonas glaciei]|jgi:sulfur-oxidizing protein SoxY|uniref:Quinoprotein dehydrogenase-associated SoxYZ-like carrier n=1 Tax=Aureimonas glaciei TaxID=1776957 RepID=A0A916Y9H8_9HYPH|nr:quinoprotein dehydrogenase-associated SoxYZ-like carrier [Aureimonas glaciei]GGD36185.1 quinoprotein dehydrogenase-associated SoxYZ-like carrier [Aureimonas glaciei]
MLTPLHRGRRPRSSVRLSLAAGTTALCLFIAGAAHAGTTPSPEEAAAAAESSWPGLVTDVFDDRPMQDGTGVIALEAPARATDPAIVPVKLTLDPAKKIRKVTLVIDENPSPVAATFTIGADAGLTELETRVRVNAYTDIHAVAEAEDGTLYMVKRFVKAAGGCAAPAAKDAVAAAKSLGQMRLKRFAAEAEAEGERQVAQLMIRHPNNSGLQKDQVTLLYIPAHFITDLSVEAGGREIFTMSGGISISEDPNFRFDYAGKGEETFHAKATDTEGSVFEKDFPAGSS